MHYEVNVVEQYPFSLLVAFGVRGIVSGFLEPQLHFIGNRLQFAADWFHCKPENSR